jgi:YVTN family beta-propeller protein
MNSLSNKKSTSSAFFRIGRWYALVLLILGITATSAWASQGQSDATRSTNIALNLGGNLLFNVNREANSVTVFRVEDSGKGLAKVDEVPVGREPVCVAVGKGEAFVANSGSSTVSVVDWTRGGYGVVATIPVGPEPRGCALTPDGNTLFVASFTAGTVSVIDTHSKKVHSTIQVGGNPWAIAIDNDRVFVTDFFARLIKGGPGEGFDDGKQGIVKSFLVNNPGQVEEVTISPLAESGFTANRAAYCKNTSQNNAANDTFCPDTTITDPANPKITKDPQGVFHNQFASALICSDKLYLPNIGAQPEPPVFFNANVQALVGVVDTSTRQEREDLHVNLNAQIKTEAEPAKQAGSLQRAFGNDLIAIDSDDKCQNFFIVSRGGNYVLKAQLDATGKLTINAPDNVVRFQTGNIPTGIVVDRKGKKAYVNNEVDMTVSVLNLEVGSNVGPAPSVAASTPPEPGSVEHARLMGKITFFTALGVPDIGLVGTQLRDINPVQFRGKQSDSAWSTCASCHQDGLVDGVTWIFGDGARQSIPLDGLYSKINGAHDIRINNWTAPRDSATDFNNNSRNVQCGTGFAGGDAPKFCNPASAGGLPNPAVRDHGISQGASEALDMETAWLQTTVRAPNQPKGPNADKGRDLFETTCASCHGGAKWTKSQVIYLNNPAVDKAGVARDPGLTLTLGQAVEYKDGKVDPNILRFLVDVGTFNANSPIEIRSNPANAAVDGRGALGSLGFNVPSLLGVNSSAPYFHNGQAQTLDEVFAQHKLPGGATIQGTFGAADLAAFGDFLKSIDGSTALLRNQTDDFKDPFIDMTP